MDSAEFDEFIERSVRSYAGSHIRTGRWTREEGLAEARKELHKLLPNGLQTVNHFFFTIIAGSPEDKVGAIWLAVEARGGFVYDLLVFDQFRRRGYAEAAMRAIERVADEKGTGKLSLHVFGDNLGARKLYAKLGYTEISVMMSKSLAP
ncbi:MAG TPA: GNAT family N-acetyltransferase [Thermoplasmata archaeon]|jgi:ribosomal protein S18 acetylase RimI-like enzyme|nr:GNAT family N-acetyltransferase [Thermoplasmata archaeon]